MSDINNPDREPVEEAPKSLREIAEQSWNEIEAEPSPEGEGQAPAIEGDQTSREPQTGQDGRSRDSLGRFVSGEQSQDPAPGTPPIQAPTGVQPHPAPPGSSSEAPAHWSPEDRATFAKLPQEGQAFLLRRHTEMERDYQGKVQQSATAVQFTQALAPVFEEPRMKAALADVEGRPLHPVHAIQQWASFHLRAIDPNPQVRAGLLQELAQRMQLDPAALGNPSPPPGLSQQDLQDPAVKYFADHVGRTVQEVQALRGELNAFKASEAERQNEVVLRTTRQGIDSFADARDPQGNKLYPHFDAVLPQLIDLFKVDPGRDLKEAYETAVWMAPTVRQGLLQQEKSRDEQKRQNGRASLAARGNIRGRTSPVSKPDANGAGPKSLRETIAAAADEVGFEG